MTQRPVEAEFAGSTHTFLRAEGQPPLDACQQQQSRVRVCARVHQPVYAAARGERSTCLRMDRLEKASVGCSHLGASIGALVDD